MKTINKSILEYVVIEIFVNKSILEDDFIDSFLSAATKVPRRKSIIVSCFLLIAHSTSAAGAGVMP